MQLVHENALGTQVDFDYFRNIYYNWADDSKHEWDGEYDWDSVPPVLLLPSHLLVLLLPPHLSVLLPAEGRPVAASWVATATASAATAACAGCLSGTTAVAEDACY